MATFVADHASVHPQAEIDDDVEIGPFCVVGPAVRIGRGTRLVGNVTVLGDTTIGCHNVIHPGTVIGGDPHHGPGNAGVHRRVMGNQPGSHVPKPAV